MFLGLVFAIHFDCASTYVRDLTVLL